MNQSHQVRCILSLMTQTMNTPESSEIIIREGTYSDNEGLIHLTSLTSMRGRISIRVDRRPDFFRLLELRGPSFVLVAELNGTIIGSGAASAVNVCINGKPETVYYLGDFRVLPDFRKSTVAARLAAAAFKRLEDMHADLVCGTVVLGNNAITSFLKGGKLWYPAQNAGLFNVYQLLPSPVKSRKNKYLIQKSPLESSLVCFFNNFSQKFQLGPVYTENSLKNTTLLTASLNSRLVAAISLVDMSNSKQDRLLRLPCYLKMIFKGISALHTILQVVKLPESTENIKILYIKSMAYNPGHEDAFKLLLDKSINTAYQQKYHFLTIGIHKKNPVIRIFSNYPKFTLKSTLYIGSLKNNKEKMNEIIQGIPFEDYSLV